MDYPLDWRQVFTTVSFLDKILKFSKIILEFSDSPTQILMGFLSRKTVSQLMRTEYFSDDCLMPNFIHTHLDQPIKVTPSVIKVTPAHLMG